MREVSNETRDPRVSCEFTVYGDERFDPDVLTQAVSLVPTTSWRKGERVVWPDGRLSPVRRHSVWSLSTGDLFTVELPEVLESLLSRIEPHRDALVDFVDRLGVRTEFSCAVALADQAPIVNFPSSSLQRIAALRASLDVDLYVVDRESLPPRPEAGTSETSA